MLTKRQARFVQEFLIDLNAKQAAIRAGYSPRSAEVEGSRLTRHPKVAAALADAQKGRAQRTGITGDQVIAELARIGFSDIRNVVSWRTLSHRALTDPETGEIVIMPSSEVTLVDSSRMDAGAAAAIAEVSQSKDGTLKVKLHDKRAALVDIGRHLGLFGAAGKGRPAGDEPPPSSPEKDGWDSLLH